MGSVLETAFCKVASGNKFPKSYIDQQVIHFFKVTFTKVKKKLNGWYKILTIYYQTMIVNIYIAMSFTFSLWGC